MGKHRGLASHRIPRGEPGLSGLSPKPHESGVEWPEDRSSQAQPAHSPCPEMRRTVGGPFCHRARSPLRLDPCRGQCGEPLYADGDVGDGPRPEQMHGGAALLEEQDQTRRTKVRSGAYTSGNSAGSTVFPDVAELRSLVPRGQERARAASRQLSAQPINPSNSARTSRGSPSCSHGSMGNAMVLRMAATLN
jgi:hypothetical protein